MERIQIETGMSIKLEIVGRLTVDPGWEGDSHQHPFREIIYNSDGCMDVIVEFTKENVRIPFAPGKSLLIPPHIVHRIVNASDTVPATLIYVGYASDDSLLITSPLMLTDDMDKDLKTLLENLASRPQMLSTQTILISKLGLLSEELAKYSPLVTQEKNPQELLANKVKAYLKMNYRRNLTVAEIAGALYLTPHYLGVVFRNTTGMTIHEYLLHIRMQKAIDLMRDTSISLSAISEQLGFDTPQYFSNCFKRYYMVSPSEFRKKHLHGFQRPNTQSADQK
ncbi:MAG: AraC family transcriptional regulator [Clostridia bacterium]|nr:AraC family transcriptional regulator [Clostridia bacterium]